MKNKPIYALLSVIVMLLLVGCKAKAPLPLGYTLPPEIELTRYESSHLFYHVDQNALDKLQDLKVIAVDHVMICSPPGEDKDFSLALEYRDLLQDRLYFNLVNQLTPQFLVCQPTVPLRHYQELNYGIVKLRLELIDVAPGIGFVRWLIGYGVGGVLVQVEGSLVNAATGQTIARFIVKMRHSGQPYLGLNPRVFSTKYCFRNALDVASEEITDFCSDLLTP
jgi:hypothetical protein